jgi:hypothetical protein
MKAMFDKPPAKINDTLKHQEVKIKFHHDIEYSARHKCKKLQKNKEMANFFTPNKEITTKQIHETSLPEQKAAEIEKF